MCKALISSGGAGNERGSPLRDNEELDPDCANEWAGRDVEIGRWWRVKDSLVYGAECDEQRRGGGERRVPGRDALDSANDMNTSLTLTTRRRMACFASLDEQTNLEEKAKLPDWWHGSKSFCFQVKSVWQWNYAVVFSNNFCFPK